MKALVTGANGMLGQAVVRELQRRGHDVRALIRPTARIEQLGWQGTGIEIFRADLRAAPNLQAAFEDIDVLIHLAAAVTGTDELQFASTVAGTERLLTAMARCQTKSVVLASSFSVYDYGKIRRGLTEDCPLEAKIYARDGYAVAKIWQERLVRRFCAENGWNLVVLRPGFIWGSPGALFAGAGQGIGSLHVIIGPLARAPLTHVANCADAFVCVAENVGRVRGQTFNVADGHEVTNWRFVRCYRRHHGVPKVVLPVPYRLAFGVVRAIGVASRLLFRGKGKLPSIFVPYRFQARFKPLRSNSAKLHRVLGWSAPYDFDQCLQLSYTTPARGALPADGNSGGIGNRVG